MLQDLNTVLDEPEVTVEANFTKLRFVVAELKKHGVLALVDSSTTHNFIKREVAKQFGLKIEPKTNSFKAVNSEVEKVVGLAQRVPLKLGE